MQTLKQAIEQKRAELKKTLDGKMPDYPTVEFGKMQAYEEWFNWLEHLRLNIFPEGEFE